MNVVLDTNALLVCIGRKSKYHSLFEAIISGKVELIVTTEILNEYHEIISKLANFETAENTIEALIKLPTVKQVNVFYNWNLITSDQDDNKFVDAAIAGHADYLVSNDRHYDVLAKLDFPKINIISLQDFMATL